MQRSCEILGEILQKILHADLLDRILVQRSPGRSCTRDLLYGDFARVVPQDPSAESGCKEFLDDPVAKILTEKTWRRDLRAVILRT